MLFMFVMLICAALIVDAQVQSTTYAAHESRAPTPFELQNVNDSRSNLQDQIDTILGVTGSTGSTLSNVAFAGTESNKAFFNPGSEGFLMTNGLPSTNTTGQRGFITIPFSSTGAAWNALLIVTNYSGPIGGAATVTNIRSYAKGSATTTVAASNIIQGWIYPNSSFAFTNTVGTVAILNATNTHVTIDWQ